MENFSGTTGSLGMGIGAEVEVGAKAEEVGGGMEFGFLLERPLVAVVELEGSGVSLNIFSSAISHFISVWRGTLNGKGRSEGKRDEKQEILQEGRLS